MFYEDSSKQWLRPGENGTLTSINNAGVIDAQKFSNVQLWQGGNRAIFRIIAKRIFDGRTLIEQTIFQKLKYQAATKCFHQWRNENRQVYGLSFSNEQEAERFLSFVQNALEYVSSSNGHYQPVNGHANNVNGNVHYQEAVYYQQQQANDAQHYKDADEDSLGSANSIHPNTYRKSSYSVNVANGVGAMPSNSIIQQQQQQLHTASAIQRRASQGSNSSSSNSTNGVSVNNVAYATSNTSNIISNPNVIGRLNINGPPGNPHASVVQSIVPPTQSSSTTEVAPGSACSSSSGISTAAPPAPPPPPPLPPTLSTGVPPISKNAPPPPPPPPPMLKAGNGAKPLSMAESLKQAKLRSVSTAASNGVNRTSNSNSSDSGVGSKTSTINSTTSGHVNLLSELEATIQKRKTTVEGRPSAGDVGEKRSNGVEAVPRPWQKLSNATAASSNIVSGTTDSPRIQRKATSGASLCSQDEPKPSNNGVTGSGTVTFADLERFKQEIITEVNKAKQEILLAIRQEFAQLRSE